MIDRHVAMELLESLGEQDHIELVVVGGDPPSKARPRFNSRGRPYTPKKTVEGEKHLAAAFSSVPRQEGNVAIVCIFYRRTFQRIDTDNMLKAVLDAGTRAKIWEDDSQVTALVGIAEYDRQNPRTVVAFGNHESTLLRGSNTLVECESCGEKFTPGGHRRIGTARWCSQDCRMRLADPVECRWCERPFKRRSGNQVLCSDACRIAELNKRVRL